MFGVRIQCKIKYLKYLLYRSIEQTSFLGVQTSRQNFPHQNQQNLTPTESWLVWKEAKTIKTYSLALNIDPSTKWERTKTKGYIRIHKDGVGKMVFELFIFSYDTLSFICSSIPVYYVCIVFCMSESTQEEE